MSYATAVASQRIAEASQRDSALMKRIAEDSREVALRAWRDGVDMRIMAAVTLLALPGTFTAVRYNVHRLLNFFQLLIARRLYSVQASSTSDLLMARNLCLVVFGYVAQ